MNLSDSLLVDHDLVEPKNDVVYLQQPVSSRVRDCMAMLGNEERILPAYFAALTADQPGALVELGCYLGGSSLSLLDGLSQRGCLTSSSFPALYTFDLFEATDYMVEHSLHRFGIASGESFFPAYQQQLGDWFNYVKCTSGTILDFTWPPEPIKILYVDILWSWEINQYVFDQFMRRLVKGAFVIHQDYVYSLYPWLPVMMEWLVEKGYFCFRSFAPYSTVAFECLRSPSDLPAGFRFDSDISLERKETLIRTSASRFVGYPRTLLTLSLCALWSQFGEQEMMEKLLDEIEAGELHPLEKEHVQLVRESCSTS